MTRIIKYEINEDKITINDFLRKRGYQSKIISQLRRTENGILVDDMYVYTTYVLRSGQTLVVKILDEKPSENIVCSEILLDIVFEDEDIMVINKQAFLPVHPSQGHFEDTLANGLAKYFENQDFTFRCVNRLDKNTSGLLIIAKNRLSSGILAEDLKENKIHRQYLAICKGEMDFEEKEINAPIARANDSTIERTVDFVNGQPAITHLKVLKRQNNHSLVSLKLETGRTHQIRVHLKHIGFPIIGDFLYNPDFENIDRQALHSYKLEFKHPISKQNLVFTKNFPSDMTKIFENKFN